MHLKWTSHLGLSVQNFIFPERKMFLAFGGGGRWIRTPLRPPYGSPPPPPAQGFYTPCMRKHWENCLQPPDKQLYDAREEAAHYGRLSNIVGIVEGPNYWDRRKNPQSSQRRYFGGMELLRSHGIVPTAQRIESGHGLGGGIVADYCDLYVQFPNGHRLRNAKFELAVDMPDGSCRFRCLEQNLRALFGADWVDFRGAFAYPPMVCVCVCARARVCAHMRVWGGGGVACVRVYLTRG